LLRTRLLSFGMILGIAFLLMVSLVLGAVIAALGKWWSGVFAMIYKLMPRAKVRWHDVLLGAVVTAGLFTVGKVLIGLYIGKTAVASSYGAAGSIVVLLLWVYYSAQIFLLGAEFTWVYARTFGSMREQADSTAALRPARIPPSHQTPPETPALPSSQLRPLGTSRTSRKTLIEFGLGIAAVLAVRFVVPRILGRSSRSYDLW
jgi:membrane protein